MALQAGVTIINLVWFLTRDLLGQMGRKHNKTDSCNPDVMHPLLCSANPVAMTCIVEAGGTSGMPANLQVGSQIFCKLF